MAPIVSHLVKEKIIEARAFDQIETFSAGIQWARAEGFISAPETNHAIAAVVQEAERAKQEGKEKVILFNWSGHFFPANSLNMNCLKRRFREPCGPSSSFLSREGRSTDRMPGLLYADRWLRQQELLSY
jgi:hypothetical protein